jgi:hypothetical protein
MVAHANCNTPELAHREYWPCRGLLKITSVAERDYHFGIAPTGVYMAPTHPWQQGHVRTNRPQVLLFNRVYRDTIIRLDSGMKQL